MSTTKFLAARARQASAAGEFDADFSGPVPSPCMSVCRIAEDGDYCIGCFRTLDDVRDWSKADNARRRAIWAAALHRAGADLPKELR
ncbi:MAG: DUF1289 domain-containing protein [Proteobacteria bacterium]|nr:DUF1289 domain-containing protein [Pseudomonadota bacterium]